MVNPLNRIVRESDTSGQDDVFAVGRLALIMEHMAFYFPATIQAIASHLFLKQRVELWQALIDHQFEKRREDVWHIRKQQLEYRSEIVWRHMLGKLLGRIGNSLHFSKQKA